MPEETDEPPRPSILASVVLKGCICNKRNGLQDKFMFCPGPHEKAIPNIPPPSAVQKTNSEIRAEAPNYKHKKTHRQNVSHQEKTPEETSGTGTTDHEHVKPPTEGPPKTPLRSQGVTSPDEIHQGYENNSGKLRINQNQGQQMEFINNDQESVTCSSSIPHKRYSQQMVYQTEDKCPAVCQQQRYYHTVPSPAHTNLPHEVHVPPEGANFVQNFPQEEVTTRQRDTAPEDYNIQSIRDMNTEQSIQSSRLNSPHNLKRYEEITERGHMPKQYREELHNMSPESTHYQEYNREETHIPEESHQPQYTKPHQEMSQPYRERRSYNRGDQIEEKGTPNVMNSNQHTMLPTETEISQIHELRNRQNMGVTDRHSYVTEELGIPDQSAIPFEENTNQQPPECNNINQEFNKINIRNIPNENVPNNQESMIKERYRGSKMEYSEGITRNPNIHYEQSHRQMEQEYQNHNPDRFENTQVRMSHDQSMPKGQKHLDEVKQHKMASSRRVYEQNQTNSYTNRNVNKKLTNIDEKPAARSASRCSACRELGFKPPIPVKSSQSRKSTNLETVKNKEAKVISVPTENKEDENTTEVYASETSPRKPAIRASVLVRQCECNRRNGLGGGGTCRMCVWTNSPANKVERTEEQKSCIPNNKSWGREFDSEETNRSKNVSHVPVRTNMGHGNGLETHLEESYPPQIPFRRVTQTSDEKSTVQNYHEQFEAERHKNEHQQDGVLHVQERKQNEQDYANYLRDNPYDRKPHIHSYPSQASMRKYPQSQYEKSTNLQNNYSNEKMQTNEQVLPDMAYNEYRRGRDIIPDTHESYKQHYSDAGVNEGIYQREIPPSQCLPGQMYQDLRYVTQPYDNQQYYPQQQAPYNVDSSETLVGEPHLNRQYNY